MDISCPCCGVKFPIVAGLNDTDGRRFAALMGRIPPDLAPTDALKQQLEQLQDKLKADENQH